MHRQLECAKLTKLSGGVVEDEVRLASIYIALKHLKDRRHHNAWHNERSIGNHASFIHRVTT